MDYTLTIEDTLVYIGTHLEDPLTLDIIADALHMSKYYLHRLFRAAMGITLKQYILMRKIHHAFHLITHTDRSLSDIGLSLGFGNQASFIRAFKKETAITPGQLRQHPNKIALKPLPTYSKRTLKNINGDLVTEFSLDYTSELTLTGFAFEIDLKNDNYKEIIHQFNQQLTEEINATDELSRYMVYSDCDSGSSKFKALLGVPSNFSSEYPNTFTVTIPSFFCARFKYNGDLLSISDIFKSDFAQFINLTRHVQANHGIELIQVFHPKDTTMTDYHILVPIEPTEGEV